MGFCLDMTAAATPSPPAMEDDTGKKESEQKQVQSASGNSLKTVFREGQIDSLTHPNDVDCVHTLLNRSSRPFATDKYSDKGLNQTAL